MMLLLEIVLLQVDLSDLLFMITRALKTAKLLVMIMDSWLTIMRSSIIVGQERTRLQVLSCPTIIDDRIIVSQESIIITKSLAVFNARVIMNNKSDKSTCNSTISNNNIIKSYYTIS